MPLHVSLFDDDANVSARRQNFSGGFGLRGLLDGNGVELLRDDGKLQNSRNFQGVESPVLGFDFNSRLELSPQDMRSEMFSRASVPSTTIFTGSPALNSSPVASMNISPGASPLFSHKATAALSPLESFRRDLQSSPVEPLRSMELTPARITFTDPAVHTPAKAAVQTLSGPWDSLSLPRMIQFEAQAREMWREPKQGADKPKEARLNAEINSKCNGTAFYSSLRAEAAKLSAQ
mmetsp:Transcript_28511/g.44583  ORF Transcript_28511/g.44583 Transcript_28511/m.44583 type:complete len:234 (+) Transcript_28511:64-765(+)|eukprot:CAMPEP_0169224202 /NCGR_PEP_ID=MMETSP1016-20121227/22535_1 /TAXON_ID=342587 /ORGANISM="Karlodinium micrum, Strain CCMP2283" /LENGTH=233 /DNA_ID=CAMNT_0009302619 /DNA_START=56 /DNA_END=757 /DNA_ORIENTATION=-